METKTPRTDALDCGIYGYGDYVRVLPLILALARELEAKLAEYEERTEQERIGAANIRGNHENKTV